MTTLRNLVVLSLLAILPACAAEVSDVDVDDSSASAVAVDAGVASPVTEPEQQPAPVAMPAAPQEEPAAAVPSAPEPSQAQVPPPSSDPAPATLPTTPTTPAMQPTPATPAPHTEPAPEPMAPTKCRINAGQTYGGQVIECGGHWAQYFPSWTLTWKATTAQGSVTYNCNQPIQCVKGARCEWRELGSATAQVGVCQ